uniref:Transmembrane protein n=1 Tax=Salix viminalis TaxID=40686 RepID=A0A6N2K412_SALVM
MSKAGWHHQPTHVLTCFSISFHFRIDPSIKNNSPRKDMPMLSRTTSSSRTPTLLLLFLILSLLVSFFAAVCSFYGSTANTSRLNWAGLFGLVVLIAVAARATVLAWITVVVLLAFAGRRRRVLVQQGRKITADVIMYLIRGGALTINENQKGNCGI